MTTRRRWGLAGVVAAIYAFLLAPFVVLALSSLSGGEAYYIHFPPRGLSARWYLAIPASYLRSFAVSVALGVASALIAGLLGVAAALGIVWGRCRRKELLKAFFRAPLQIPLVVSGVVFLQFYYVLFGLTGIRLLENFTGLLLAHVFISLPFVVGTVCAVLEKFDRRLEEAAYSLGASRWATFRRVTLPVIRPGVFAGMLYAFIMSFGNVPVSLFLVGPRLTTLPVDLFYSMEYDFNPSILALSTLVVVFSVMTILLLQRLMGLDILLRTGAKE